MTLTTPTQSQVEATLQSDLLPGLTGSTHNPPAEHIGSPPSTVDTAALSEEPLPVKPVSRPVRAAHICPLCNKQFKNSYNLRRHQSVHTGIRMKDRAAREVAEGVKDEGTVAAAVIGGRVERQTVPLSLLHLSVPLPSPAVSVPHPPALGSQDGEAIAMSLSAANVAMASPPPPAVVVAGATLQAFRDVYHLNRHRLSHSDEKPYSCPICQQRFKRKDRMSYHVRSHQGGVEKPYVCPHCAKGFSRPDHLNSHVRQVHSTERPFKCETCESAFATRDRLRAHMIRHEEKHSLLPDSPAGFTTLTYLRVHAQKHHGQEWKESAGQRGGFGGTGPGGVLVCQLCGVHCKTPTQLQGHMGTHTSPQNSSSPVHSTAASSSTVSLGNVVSGSSVFVSANAGVGLLVSDCSGIAPQSHTNFVMRKRAGPPGAAGEKASDEVYAAGTENMSL
ncbi:Myc-associated zinc finger protein-like, partial [Scleropages formosus]